ncbi:hypothetical protein, partial [Acinetobacter sp. YH12049]|uniref:hypothetical protein n=1 Tax=Acinetobacter sp. YH12049 TaxID=2601054 RepID=UPI0035A01593
VPAYGPQNDVTLKMPAFEWVHVQLHQQKGMISLSPPTICNSAKFFNALPISAIGTCKKVANNINASAGLIKLSKIVAPLMVNPKITPIKMVQK